MTRFMPINTYKKNFNFEEILKSVKEYLPDVNLKRLKNAFSFAKESHRGQFRRDGKTPYLVHPVATMQILTTFHADEDTLVSALLHDVPEDTGKSIDEIKNLFGNEVAFLVEGITKLSKVHYKHNMEQRQIESLKKMLLHSAEDLRVILIKLADRLHNMQTLENIDNPAKRIRIATETLEIYVPIANLLGIRDIKFKLEFLCFKHLFPKEFEEITKKIKSNEKKRSENTAKFIEKTKEIFDKENIKAVFKSHEKNPYRIYKKINSLGLNINDIDDRITIKIIVEDIPQCYQVLGAIHGKFVPKTDRFKDYIANPKINGYQSLHTAVFGVDGVLTEIQICTKKMDIEDEYGIAANFFLKKDIKDASILTFKGSAWLKKILEIEKTAKVSGNFMEDLRLDIFQDRIFVFTPKGEPIDLPKGASVIDFAYAIHTLIGHHALKAEINNRTRSITTTLKTGDVVNVITSRKISPELSWLSFAKTNLARSKILAYLRKISIEKKIREGRKILQKEFDIAELGLCGRINFKKLREILLNNLNKDFKTFDDVLAAICEGDLRAIDVVAYVQENLKHKKKIFEDDLGKGVRISLKIIAKNRFGLLRDIADILYKHALDMYSLKGWASKYEKDAYFTTELLVKNPLIISQIFDELQQIEDVQYVYKISRKGNIIFNIMVVFAAAVWIFHPFLIRLAINMGFEKKYPLISYLCLYLGFLSMFMLILILTSIIQKYFPMVRNKMLLWIIAFSVPLLAILILIIELFYFNLELNWLILLCELLLVYAYITINYLNYKKIMKKT